MSTTIYSKINSFKLIKSTLISGGLLLLSLLISSNCLALNYYSISDGSYNNPGNWTPAVPDPSTINSTDSVFINHDMNATGTVSFNAIYTISASASFNTTVGITIGPNATLYNNGDLTAKKQIENYGDLYNTGATNSASFYNEGYLCNSGIVNLDPNELFHNFGGLIECCGNIKSDQIHFEKNGIQLALADCQDICTTDNGASPFSTPSILEDGVATTETDFLSNLDALNPLLSGSGISFCGPIIALSIELESFAVKQIGSMNVEIRWTTVSEKDNDYYTVYRSFDGKNWEVIAQVNGAGTTAEKQRYTILDESSKGGVVYYQLEQVDFDGKKERFEIKSVNLLFEESAKIIAFPNPTTSNVSITSNFESQKNQVKLYNQLGIDVSSEIELNTISPEKINMNLSKLPVGIYYVRLGTESVKLVKMKG